MMMSTVLFILFTLTGVVLLAMEMWKYRGPRLTRSREEMVDQRNRIADKLLALEDEALAIELGWQPEVYPTHSFHTEPEEVDVWREQAKAQNRLGEYDRQTRINRAAALKRASGHDAPTLFIDSEAKKVFWDHRLQLYMTDTGKTMTAESLREICT